jgi:hypothetical protein
MVCRVAREETQLDTTWAAVFCVTVMHNLVKWLPIKAGHEKERTGELKARVLGRHMAPLGP